MKKSYFSILIALFGIILYGGSAFSVEATYRSVGTIISTNLLEGNTTSSITGFYYNLSSLPGGSSVSIQFSQNGTSWYSASGVSGGSTSLSTLGGDTVDLSSLDWSGSSFYYRLILNATPDRTGSPVVDDVKLNFVSSDENKDAFYVEETGDVYAGITGAKFSVKGGATFGANYFNLTPPTNGVIIEGNLGLGVSSPKNKLDIFGGVSVGESYAGVISAPTNGLLVEGNVGIGVTSPSGILDINTDTGRELYFSGSSIADIYQSVSGQNLNIETNGGNIEFNVNGDETKELIISGINGNMGFGVFAPTAVLHLKAGTATAGTAPLKLTSSGADLLTTPEAGAMEYNGTDLFFTPSSGTRETVAFVSDLTGGLTSYVPYTGATTDVNLGAYGLTANTITISNTGAVSHLAFSRGNFNYITAPTSGTIAFVVNGQPLGSATSELAIEDGSLYPGTTNVTSLGKSSLRFSDVYSVLGDFSGRITGSGGATISGASINLNDSSNYSVNIATGTSTGVINIGGGSNTVAINSSDWDISTTGAMTGITGIANNGAYTQTGTSANTFTGTSTFSGGLVLGDGGDDIAINSNDWDISSAGAVTGITTIATSGKITSGGYLNLTNDNLLHNGDFDTGTKDGWSGSGTTVVTGGYSGNYALQVTGPSSVVSDDYIPIDPVNDVIQLEGYLKKTVAGTTPGNNYFGYMAYDENKTVITSPPCGTYCYFAASGYVVPVDDTWHKVSATTTGEGTVYPNFPVGTKYIRVLILAANGGSADTVLQVDHISLKRINNGPLFVGNNFSTTNLYDQHQTSKIFTNISNALNFTTPSNGNYIFNGTGNVGIGTTAPKNKLDIEGGAVIGATYSGTNTAPTNGLLVEGNVGIGTTSPVEKLDVGGALRISGARTNGLGASGFLSYESGGITTLIGNGPDDTTVGQIQLSVRESDSGGMLNVLRINSAGNVGIGTTSPSTKLHVVGAIYSTSYIQTLTDLYTNSITTTSGNLTIDPAGAGDIIMQGSVGIGTTSPGAKLDVNGAVRISGISSGTGNKLSFDTTGSVASNWIGTTNDYWTSIVNGRGSGSRIDLTNNDIRFTFDTDTGNMILKANGSVGIGTTTPQAKLDISAGNLDLDNTTNANQFGVISKNGTRFIHDFNYGDNGTVTTVGGNTFIGLNSGNLTMGSTATSASHSSYNTGIGYETLYSNTTGYYNSALGFRSLHSNLEGNSNSALGMYSLFSNTTGSSNSALGNNSLFSNIAGSGNSALGRDSGRYTSDGTTGRTTGNYGLYLGYNTKASDQATTNEIVIGYDATGAGSNTAVIGNSSLASVYLGSTTPNAKLYTKDANISSLTASKVVFTDASKNLTSTGIGTSSQFIKGDGSLDSNTYLTSASLTGYVPYTGATTDVVLGAHTLSTTSGIITPKIYPSSDSTTAIQFNKADGTTNVLNIDTTNGRVGIGTTTPAVKLTLKQGTDEYAQLSTAFDMALGIASNSTKITGLDFKNFSNNGQSRLMARNNNNDYIAMNAMGTIAADTFFGQAGDQLSLFSKGKRMSIGTYDSQPLILGTANTERIRIDTSGNVGIGTTSPSAKLSVVGNYNNDGTGGILLDAYNGIDSYSLRINPFTIGTGKVGYQFQTKSVAGGTNIPLTFDNGGNVGIGTTTPQAKLDISAGNLDLDNTTNANQFGVISKNGIRFIHDFNYGDNGTVTTVGYNTFVGLNSGNLTMGSTATQASHASYNTGVGYGTLQANTTGYGISALGYTSLYSNTTGNYHSAQGFASLYSNTTGNSNSAFGSYSLSSNTTGSYNSAFGNNAGRFISDGTTGRSTGNYGLYLGYDTKASGQGTSNEIVIGYDATGAGSNTAVIGNSFLASVYLGSTTPNAKLYTKDANISSLTASKVVFTDASKNLTSTGIGTSSQFIKGDGSLDSNTYLTSASLTNYVPYTGATTNVNLGSYGLTSDTITISNTNAVNHLAFSRGSLNYITAPTSGSIAFVVNGQAVGSATSELTIQDGSISPGTTNVTSLGTSGLRWSNTYSVLGNFSGLITGSAGATISGNTISLNDSSNYAVNIATGTSTGAVNIGGTGAQTISVGAGATNAKTINIGTGAVANTIAIGSSSATNVSITDNNWSIATNGTASFAGLTSPTAKLTNLTDGYVPYHISDSSGLANSNIYYDGTNVGVGTTAPETTLSVRNSGYRQVSIRGGGTGHQTLNLGSVESTIGSYIYNNAYYSGSYNYKPSQTSASGIQFQNDGSIDLLTNTGLTIDTSYTPTSRIKITNDGKVGIGTTSPTAVLHLKAGTASQYTAPLKFTSSGANLLTTPEAGAMEYNGTDLFFTPSSGTRETVAFISDVTGASHNAVTLGAIGSSPNANGMTLTGQVLNLEPASASYGGIVTTGTQTFAGAKTFSGALTSSSILTANGAVVLGDGGDDIAISSNDWGISSLGAISGITTLSMSGQLTSTLADGTAPFNITSTTMNPNLNADLLDGKHSSDFASYSDSTFYIEGTGTVAGTWLGTNEKITSYYDGLTVRYYIPIAGASTTTLNIGGLGAKTVYLYGATKLTTHYPATSVITLTYSSTKNGGCWYVEPYYADGTESYTVRWNSTLQAGAPINSYKLVMFGATDGKVYPLTAENGTATTKTVSSVEFNPMTPVLYYGRTTPLATGEANSSYWYEGASSTSLNYTANQASGFTAYTPIYLKGTINANGNFVLAGAGVAGSTDFLTQTLPTTDDGFVYMLLGHMYNTTTSFRLTTSHPIYEYKGGKLRPYIFETDTLETVMTRGATTTQTPTFSNATYSALFTGGKVGIGTTTPSELLSLGTAGTTAGTLSLAGATSGKAIIQTSAVAGTPTLTLPATSGTLALVSDITSASHAPVTIGSSANGLSLSGQELSLGLASTSTTGALSAANWNTFNSKQDALGFTPISNVLTSAKILVGNASNVATAVTMSGDVAIANNGATTIQANSVALATDTTGNYVAGLTNGNGIATSGTAGEGWSPTIALGALTANWSQTGAYDIVLGNAGSELQIMESAGATYYGTLDVGDLSTNQTYTFPNKSGTVAMTSDIIAEADTLATVTSRGSITNGQSIQIGPSATYDPIIISAIAKGTTSFTGTITSADLTGNVTWTLPATGGTIALTSQIPSVPTGANPTATIGLSAINGTATTFMRSDASPALSQAITPTWTGVHTFNAIPKFNGGVTGTSAPFTVDSTFKVTNLNADLLDGHDTSYFQPAIETTIGNVVIDEYYTRRRKNIISDNDEEVMELRYVFPSVNSHSQNIRDAGIYGSYDTSKVQHIWSAGGAYRVASDGSTFGTLKGLAYKYAGSAGGDGVYMVQEGTATVGLGTNLWTSGKVLGDMVNTGNGDMELGLADFSASGTGVIPTSAQIFTYVSGLTLTEADTLATVTSRGSVTNGQSITVGPSATYDPIIISAKAKGTTSFTGTITSADLTANRTWTFPNKDGTVAMTSDIPAQVYPGAGIAVSTGTAWGTSITTSSGIAGAISDETGSGSLVFSASPTLTGTLTAATANFTGTSTFSNATYSALFTGGNVGIGTSTPAAKLQINVDEAEMFITSQASSAAANYGANWLQRRSRGTNASPTVVGPNDLIGGVIAQGYDGSTFRNLGRVAFYVDGTPGSSDMPGRIEFRLTPDGSATEQTRMVIKNDGNVGIGTSTPTDAKLVISNSGTIPAMEISSPNLTTSEALVIYAPASTGISDGKAFSVAATNASHASGMFYSDGKYGIGPGTGARDVYLSRPATSQLKISSDAGTGAADLLVTGKAGIGTTNPGATVEVVGGGNGSATEYVTTYNTAGTFSFTVPAGVTSVKVEAWGAGGASGVATLGGGGGGGGAYARTDSVTVTPGNSYSVVVGEGGSQNGGAQNGGSSSFNTNTVLAAGGAAGYTTDYGLGGSTGSSVGTVKYAGGRGGDGRWSSSYYGGGGGGSAGPDGTGNNGSSYALSGGGDGGSGDAGSGGAGGTGKVASNGNGGNGGANTLGGGGGGGARGSGYKGGNGGAPGAGGGGGGGANSSDSGAGADGQVKITYTMAEVLTVFSVSTTTSTNLLKLLDDGRFGISNSSPSVALDVTGDIEYTGTITDVSDMRLKENITEITGVNALSIVSALQAKSFNMKDTGKKEYGYIAQEVNEIFPDAVSIVDPENGYMGINYMAFIPLTTEAVKELNLNLNAISGTIVPVVGSATETFANNFFANMFTRIGTWLADAANGLERIFVREVRTQKLCIINEAGEETCVERAELQNLLNGAAFAEEGNIGEETEGGTEGGTDNTGNETSEESGEETEGENITEETTSGKTTAGETIEEETTGEETGVIDTTEENAETTGTTTEQEGEELPPEEEVPPQTETSGETTDTPEENPSQTEETAPEPEPAPEPESNPEPESTPDPEPVPVPEP